MVIRGVCPRGQSPKSKKNGHIHNGQQNHHCYHGNVVIRRLEVAAGEMASFAKKQAHKPWVGIAMDATTRQVMAFQVGARSHKRAKQRWGKVPEAYHV
jgi:hypothetical protein